MTRRRSTLLVSLIGKIALLGACSSTTDGGSPHIDTNSTGGATTSGATAGTATGTASGTGGSGTTTGGVTSSSGSAATTGATGTGATGTSATGTTASGNASSSGNTGTTGATSASTGSTTTSSTGSSTGTSGGGTSTGSSTSGADASAGGTSGGDSGTVTAPCPSNATFCSDFETPGMPAGATYISFDYPLDWTKAMSIDATVAHGGTHSLKVTSSGQLQMLNVPAPSPAFWTRLYVRSDMDIGQAEHNAFYVGRDADGDFNTGTKVEVAEQFNQVVLNISDAVTNSNPVTKLPKNQWHCFETSFDGPNKTVRIYANGQLIVERTDTAMLTYKSMAFGFWNVHGPARTMWYDDVVVAPARVGCP